MSVRREVGSTCSLLAVCVVLAPRGCSRPVPAATPAGRIELEWSGVRTGRLSLPVEARWCPARRRMVITAVHGDTGVGLAVFGASEPAGSFMLLPRDQTDSLSPHAALALRWVDSTSVPAFEGSTGQLQLTRTPAGRIDGTLDGSLKPLTGAGSARVRGRLVAVPVAERCDSARV